MLVFSSSTSPYTSPPQPRYVLTPRSALLEGLESQVVTCDEDTASMEEQGKALEKKLNALKGEMNDLVHAHPAIMKSLREELAA